MCDKLASLLNDSLVLDICGSNNDEDEITLGVTVCYIVAVVLINQDGEVLLIQEAKRSCYGEWYLPAGRVEPNETLVAAAKREVLEEAGILFEPAGLICVEQNGTSWFRFTFGGNIIGGSLKTTEESDSESLQARWCKDFNSESLRSRDIIKLIKQAQDYYGGMNSNRSERSLTLLPRVVPHRLLYLRAIVLTDSDKDGLATQVLTMKKGSLSHNLPVTCLYLSDGSMVNSTKRILEKNLLSASVEAWQPSILGIIGVDHGGDSDNGGDGICFNVLVTLEKKSNSSVGTLEKLPPLDANLASWTELGQLNDALQVSERYKHRIPLISLGYCS